MSPTNMLAYKPNVHYSFTPNNPNSSPSSHQLSYSIQIGPVIAILSYKFVPN